MLRSSFSPGQDSGEVELNAVTPIGNTFYTQDEGVTNFGFTGDSLYKPPLPEVGFLV